MSPFAALVFLAQLASPAEAPDLDPAADVAHFALTAAPDAAAPWQYAYNGQHPGPTLRARVGDTLVVDLDNQLGMPTSIHWHGVDVPFAMDGAGWQVSPVGAGETFTYTFTLEQAGTFWYHPHFDTEHQVDLGLYGVLIVEDPAEPAADADLIALFDIADEPAHSPRGPHGQGVLDAAWRINGALAPLRFAARGGTTVRARLINVSSRGYLDLRWPDPRQIASDQGLLPALQMPERLLLGPGDRAEVEWRIGRNGFTVQTGAWSLNGGATWQPPIDLIHVEVQDPAPAPAGRPWPFQAAAPTPDPGHTDLVYVLAGSDRTGEWRINGEKFPDVTVQRVPRGSRPIIEVRNLSPTEHPFHIHGNVFEVLSVDGQPPAMRQIEDTLNIRIHQRVRLRLEADNPGAWMTHCHILPHAEEGMMTVLEVTE
ncbi:MAG: multicopper oxidase family protein [Myxococcales bacterium]|nr:multicopper oxidase family protein [Myxococcales bacterium]